MEQRVNPFLRSRLSGVVQSVQAHGLNNANRDASEVAIFAALREWKNQF